MENVTGPQSRNPPDWGMRDVALPLITLPAGEADPEAVLKAHRRQRTLLAGWGLRLRSNLWQKASRLANWMDRRSGAG